MRIALRVVAGVDDSQSVELRDRAGMVATVLTLQQFWIAVLGRATTSAAAEITSYDRAHPKSEGGEAANSDGPVDFVLDAHFRLNPDIAPCSFRVPRAERFPPASRMRHSCNNHRAKFRKMNR